MLLLIKKIIIKTDKDFNNIYDKEIVKNNNIQMNINKFRDKYLNFIKNETNQLHNLKEEKKINNNDNNININSFFIYFNYKNNNIAVQANLNEKMTDIINRFATKSLLADKTTIYFLYDGKVINEESILSEIVKKEDIKRNQMNILVNSLIDTQIKENSSIIKSKEVNCPKCLEEINLKINNYTISLYECKNGHNFSDIDFKKFLNTQNIDLKNIICNICKQKNMYTSYNNQFYKCLTCDKNICPLCSSQHNISHKTIDYDKRNSICKEHIESFITYCKDCKKNLCMNCEKDHINHNKIYFGNILPDSNEIRIRKNELEKYMLQLNENINYYIERLNKYRENINNFYQIYNNIISSIDNKNRNYEILNNINEINNNDIINDIKNIVEETDKKIKFNLILDISNKCELNNTDEITLIYNVGDSDTKIKILDSEFVENNKNNCKIIYNNEEIELKEYFDVETNNEKLVIKLKGIKKITNASKMFYGCSNLESIPDIAKWDLSNIIDLSDIFTGCNEAINIPNKSLFK